jgi:hypothetical protein
VRVSTSVAFATVAADGSSRHTTVHGHAIPPQPVANSNTYAVLRTAETRRRRAPNQANGHRLGTRISPGCQGMSYALRCVDVIGPGPSSRSNAPAGSAGVRIKTGSAVSGSRRCNPTDATDAAGVTDFAFRACPVLKRVARGPTAEAFAAGMRHDGSRLYVRATTWPAGPGRTAALSVGAAPRATDNVRATSHDGTASPCKRSRLDQHANSLSRRARSISVLRRAAGSTRPSRYVH